MTKNPVEQRSEAVRKQEPLHREALYREALAVQLDWLRTLPAQEITPKLLSQLQTALSDTFYLTKLSKNPRFFTETDEQKNNCRLLLLEILECMADDFPACAIMFAEYYVLTMTGETLTMKQIGKRYNLTGSRVSQRVQAAERKIRARYIYDTNFADRVHRVVVWDENVNNITEQSPVVIIID